MNTRISFDTSVWSSAYRNPENVTSVWEKSASVTAFNGISYYARVNAWAFWASGFRYQRVWANSERDWGVTSTHVNDGQVKGYPSIVRGWATGEGVQPMTKAIGIQIPNLRKVRMRWAFEAPSDFGGAMSTNATNRVNVLWDTYFHTVANPGPSETAHTSLMINQYVVDGDNYYGGSAQGGQVVMLGGQQWRMVVHKQDWATHNTIELFPYPWNDLKVFGTKDLTIDYLGVVNGLVARGLIPDTNYLTSIQAGFEVIAGATLKTTEFWTAINDEADGPPTP